MISSFLPPFCSRVVELRYSSTHGTAVVPSPAGDGTDIEGNPLPETSTETTLAAYEGAQIASYTDQPIYVF